MRARRSNHRTRVLAVAATAATLATLVSVPVASAGPPPEACTFEPAATGMPLGPQLVDFYRPTGDGVAVLHRLDCPNAASQWIWLQTTAAGPAVVATFDLRSIRATDGS